MLQPTRYDLKKPLLFGQALDIRPFAQKVVIDPGELHGNLRGDRAFAKFPVQLLDSYVEVKKQ